MQDRAAYYSPLHDLFYGMRVTSKYWCKARLTLSGRPRLDFSEDRSKAETEIAIQDGVGLYQDELKWLDHQEGRLYLTNRRIIFVDDTSQGKGVSIELANVKSAEMSGRFLKASPKIALKMVKLVKKVTSSGQNKETDWICPICTFPNKSYFPLRIHDDSEIPACKTCGVRPDKEFVMDALSVSRSSVSDSQCPRCTFINHSSLQKCEICGMSLTEEETESHDDNVEMRLEDMAQTSVDENLIKLSFRNGGTRNMYEKLCAAIEVSQWEAMKLDSKLNKDAVKVDRNPVREADGPILGIQTLELKSSQDSAAKSMLLNDSLQDLEGLMSKAKELIRLSQSYQRVLMSQSEGKSADKINDNVDLLHNSKNSIKILNNIITKDEFNSHGKSVYISYLKKDSSNSSLYMDELSRHVFEFIMEFNLLDQRNGILTLFELYTIYNRARGMSLVSPDELKAAVLKFKELNLPLRLFEIEPTGAASVGKFYVISQSTFKKNSLISKIHKILNSANGTDEYRGFSVLQFQTQQGLNINHSILTSILEENASQEGELCIDQQLEGVFYYENEIIRFEWQTDSTTQ